MTAQKGKYRKVVINILIAILLSMVLNFSYLVFMMVGNHREPTPAEPAKAKTEQSATRGTEARGDLPTVLQTTEGEALADSLKRKVIIREESITKSRRGGSDYIHPMSTATGRLFMLVDIFFYGLVSMLLLTIFTHNWRLKRMGRYLSRILLAAGVLIVCYFLAPQLTWRGEIILTANASLLLHPMTLLKLTVTFTVCALYGKIFDLIYAKQAIQMENERLKNENLTWQYNTLVNQVNPHFLFNSLNSLSMLIREKNNDDAVTYIGQMSDTYRYIIEEGKAERTTVENELRFLDAYRYLLEIRYAGKLHIEVEVGHEYYRHELPPLSIQPLIENAVKHNTITSAKPLRISIKAEGDYIVVSNPISPKLQPEESTGIGLDNLSNRCELIVGRPAEISDNGKEFIVKLPINRPAK